MPAARSERLFIANRGEIAARIARTCDRLGIRARSRRPPTGRTRSTCSTSAPSSAPHAPPAPTRSTRASGSSPRTPTSPRRVEAAGIRWVGPPPAAIRAMGDKAAARRLAASLGVPVLAGYDGADQSDAALTDGRGDGSASRSSSSRRPAAAARACASSASRTASPTRSPAARREATARVRRRPADPRAARRGRPPRRDPGPVRRPRRTASTSASATARSSGATRRSSRRRRRRPSTPPCATGSARRRWPSRGAVGYVSAGTCEFLVDDRGDARLPRDEHAAPGRASGHRARHRARPRRRPAADRRRRAARVRSRGDVAPDRATRSRSASTPRTPRTASCRRPGGSRRSAGRRATGIRVDAGIELGTEIGGRFDPMLAKIIAWGADRPTALDRLGRGPRRDGRPRAS